MKIAHLLAYRSIKCVYSSEKFLIENLKYLNWYEQVDSELSAQLSVFWL